MSGFTEVWMKKPRATIEAMRLSWESMDTTHMTEQEKQIRRRMIERYDALLKDWDRKHKAVVSG